MSILEQVSQVDWAGMGTPRVPDWIEGLLSDNADERNNAYSELVNQHFALQDCADCTAACTEEELIRVMKGETIYKLVPFLIHILRDQTVADRNKAIVLAILTDLLRFHRVRDCLFTEWLDTYNTYMRRLYELVAEGIDIYKLLQENHASWLREEATLVLEFLDPDFLFG
jgi:hypothetical protein